MKIILDTETGEVELQYGYLGVRIRDYAVSHLMIDDVFDKFISSGAKKILKVDKVDENKLLKLADILNEEHNANK